MMVILLLWEFKGDEVDGEFFIIADGFSILVVVGGGGGGG